MRDHQILIHPFLLTYKNCLILITIKINTSALIFTYSRSITNTTSIFYSVTSPYSSTILQAVIRSITITYTAVIKTSIVIRVVVTNSASIYNCITTKVSITINQTKHLSKL